MDLRLDQLEDLSIRPTRLARQISQARKALSVHSPQPPFSRRALAFLSALADVVASMAGSWWQLGLSWLVGFILMRLVVATWNLPPGPWWSWSLLLGFDPVSLGGATLIVTVIIAGPIVLCRFVGKRLHAALLGQPPPPLTRQPALIATTALVLVMVVLGSCVGRRNDDRVSNCGDAWEPSPLGQNWWLLRCPNNSDPAGGCEILRGSEHDKIKAGQQLIVPATQLLRIEFVPSARHCASQVRLAGDKSDVSTNGQSPVDNEVNPIKVDPIKFEPAVLKQTVELSLDGHTAVALSALAAALNHAAQRIPSAFNVKVDVSGRVKADLPNSIAATLELPQLQNLVDISAPLVSEYAAANASERTAQRLKIQCETRRRARNLLGRAGNFIDGDLDCLKATELP